ncbi:nuclear transport factor 2 family protein [Algoriphagus sp. CAU 1675]|uniref:nuclear transport factor 2 family protein n=1 Tax=Algoriphagus sp. CAU 1675 TaxID=3032597 RepID=UPI0023DCB44A|nr:nuclear transport factor 2 family protein [Algoriphagus sp. CAU 1675]MDF2156749.1 nuclear transport factor 2 family protein [Algoriphagus sp. CAU 1675]
MTSLKTIIQGIGLLCFGFLSIPGYAQKSNPETEAILTQRQASNLALKAFDEELNNTFLTDDVLITTGAGTLISGKEALIEYIQKVSGSRMFWVRTPDEIIVNPDTQLAWETGTWKGYQEGSEEAMVGGKYSAQWTKKSGTWLIQSQLFVTLTDE